MRDWDWQVKEINTYAYSVKNLVPTLCRISSWDSNVENFVKIVNVFQSHTVPPRLQGLVYQSMQKEWSIFPKENKTQHITSISISHRNGIVWQSGVPMLTLFRVLNDHTDKNEYWWISSIWNIIALMVYLSAYGRHEVHPRGLNREGGEHSKM